MLIFAKCFVDLRIGDRVQLRNGHAAAVISQPAEGLLPEGMTVMLRLPGGHTTFLDGDRLQVVRLFQDEAPAPSEPDEVKNNKVQGRISGRSLARISGA